MIQIMYGGTQSSVVARKKGADRVRPGRRPLLPVPRRVYDSRHLATNLKGSICLIFSPRPSITYIRPKPYHTV